MAIGKMDLIEKVAEATGQKKKEAETFLNTFIDVVEKELKAGNEVNITGFGKFHVSDRPARTGRNPKTGEKVQIAAKKAPIFRAGAQFKDAVG